MEEVSYRAKSTLVSVSESMFPGISTSVAGKTTLRRGLGNEMVSSLPLQVLMFLNVIYFPVWLSILLMVTWFKFALLNYLYKFVLTTVLVAFSTIEIVRLYLGYLGNLKERVPELAGFWLLSVLLQLPLAAFLLFNTDLILVPIETAADIIMFIFIVAELFIGFFSLRTMTRHQAYRFHLQEITQMSNLEGYVNKAYSPDLETNKVV
ncbi:transmembrane protein 17 [Eurytemora carolleeae]|uniref:transmembrane protein 17 n=1 Tax=Eurytemora carolleeae TaxID=1294199 RepID=UPI000C7631A1|nr:transmembrane protein 17 [Eurytemora carolleeae]XP_023328417.1 transmembrane protein 17 [Eurytemora carolleeae]|eukprot:XP_023328416.1 transmembrane protein 17-like [Eurytemora affinis]